MERLELESVRLVEDGGDAILEGWVNGRRLYFRAPRSFELQSSANPFLAAMLIPAMQRGADIVIPERYPVSPDLLAGIGNLQPILSCWYPELTPVSVVAHADLNEAPARSNAASGCLFSGGLDACYSLLKHARELSHLVYIRGIDLQLDNEPVFRTVASANSEIADYMGKELVVIESNIRFFMRELESPPLSWYVNQAGGLAAVCLTLGLPRVFISSSNCYDALHPLGSHPLTDPMWSTRTTEIVHTGCEKRRHEKLATVAEHDVILQRVRVCWHDAGFNCGVCDKCMHFRVALAIMGLEVSSLSRLQSYDNLHGAHVNTDGEYAEWKDNLLLARKFGDKRAAKAVNRLLNRYKVKVALKLLDDALAGGRLRSTRLRFLGRAQS